MATVGHYRVITAADTNWSTWTNSTSGVLPSSEIWIQWAVSDTTTSDITSTVTSFSTRTTWTNWIQPVIVRRTEAEIAEANRLREEANRRYAAEAEARKKEQEEAAAKAEALLLEYLSEQERAEYVAEGQFHVLSADGVSRYRIKKGQYNNVEKLNRDGKVEKIFCSHPAGVPDQDNMLAQRFALLHFEEDFEKKMANVRKVG